MFWAKSTSFPTHNPPLLSSKAFHINKISFKWSNSGSGSSVGRPMTFQYPTRAQHDFCSFRGKIVKNFQSCTIMTQTLCSSYPNQLCPNEGVFCCRSSMRIYHLLKCSSASRSECEKAESGLQFEALVVGCKRETCWLGYPQWPSLLFSALCGNLDSLEHFTLHRHPRPRWKAVTDTVFG